jgi:DNA-binding XRE family transcriptional regulator
VSRPPVPAAAAGGRPALLSRGRPRAFPEWRALRRWGKLPPWEAQVAGYLLRQAREDAGLTQRELGQRLGISQQAVAQAERWVANPTVGLMRRWAASCGAELLITIEPAVPSAARHRGALA